MVRGLLAEDGVLVISCPGTLTYMSDELRNLNAMVFFTLQEAFPHVRPIPGDLTIWLASPSEKLATTSVEALIERWKVRGLETQLISAPHIRLRFNQRYLDWFWRNLGAAEGGMTATDSYLNRDLHPMGQFHGLAYWNAAFSPGVARVIALTSRMDLWVVSLPIIGCSLFFLAVAKLTGKRGGTVLGVQLHPVDPSLVKRAGGFPGRFFVSAGQQDMAKGQETLGKHSRRALRLRPCGGLSRLHRCFGVAVPSPRHSGNLRCGCHPQAG